MAEIFGRVVKDIVNGAGNLGFESCWTVKSVTLSPAARHRCDILRSCGLTGAVATETSPAIRCVLWRNTVSIMKI